MKIPQDIFAQFRHANFIKIHRAYNSSFFDPSETNVLFFPRRVFPLNFSLQLCILQKFVNAVSALRSDEMSHVRNVSGALGIIRADRGNGRISPVQNCSNRVQALKSRYKTA